MTVRCQPPALAACSTPRRLGLPSQAASLAECPCVAMPWVGFLTPAALLHEDYVVPITPQFWI